MMNVRKWKWCLIIVAAMLVPVASADLDLTTAVGDMSSVGWGLGHGNAFDDAAGTKTATNGQDPAHKLPPVGTSTNQWLWVDLGSDLTLSNVSIDFQFSAGVDYTIRMLTEAEGTTYGLTTDGTAGTGGEASWTTIATATGLTANSPTREIEGNYDSWDFTGTGTVVIPDNTTGTTAFNVLNPTGRYLMIDATISADPTYGTISIWDIDVVSALPGRSDFNKDWSVDSLDLAQLIQVWLSTDSGLPQDLYPDNKIDINDFALFAADWFDE